MTIKKSHGFQKYKLMTKTEIMQLKNRQSMYSVQVHV